MTSHTAGEICSNEISSIICIPDIFKTKIIYDALLILFVPFDVGTTRGDGP
jgi:hypothetical protein